MATSKDYKAIAQIIKDWTTVTYEGHVGEVITKIPMIRREAFVGSLIQYFASDNPRFDRDKFVDAVDSQD